MTDMNLTPREERKLKEKQRRKQVMQKIKLICVPMFVGIIALFVILNLVTKDKTFSEQENRMLAQKPVLTTETLFDGSFMSDMESYIADQFVFRDGWIRLKLIQDRFLGKREANGVYLGKDNYLMEKAAKPNEAQLEKNLKAIQDFSQKYSDVDMYMTLVPNAVHVLEEYLPNHAPAGGQDKQIQSVKNKVDNFVEFIDVMPNLTAHATEGIYYKTDHHWTSLGAYYAFDKIASVMNISVTNEYDILTVSNDFTGTLASKTGYTNIKDTVEIYVPKNVENDYIVYYADEARKTASVYEVSKLEEKDKYTVFMGGNHPITEITSANPEKRVLLMFKDSYANCLVPFLTPYFREIVIIDPRYYYENIESIIVNKGVTDVLFLYNVNTFLEDTSLGDVLNE